MIKFMVIGLPRSGTTWASNWLTTDDTICIHDPLWTTHYNFLDKIEKGSKSVGVACTGLYRFPDWVNRHPAKKVVIRRPLAEINASMQAIGLPDLTPDDLALLMRVEGVHCDFSDLFCQTTAAGIYRYLLGKPMDLHRHAELVQIEMQPKFSGLKVGAEVTRRLIDEVRAAIE